MTYHHRQSDLTFLHILSVALSIVQLTYASFHSANVIRAVEQVKEEYDYVIAGGGTAGLTVGDRLSADGKYSVLVIEYGIFGGVLAGMDPSREFVIPSIPQAGLNNRSIPVVVGKLVGGSSGINGLQFFRGTKEEYDLWAQVGGNGSTWDWNGMLPYFKRGIHFVPPLEYLAKDFNISWDMNAWGQDNDTRVFAGYPNYLQPELKLFYEGMVKMPGIEIPKDGNAGTDGLYFYPTTMDPASYSRSYSRTGHWDGINRSNYELLISSKVTRIVFDGNRAKGLSFVPINGNSSQITTVRARKEVIIAAGAIHTPQILQLSGIGPTSVLLAANISQMVDLPGVGTNFQDHGYIRGPQFVWGAQPPVPVVNTSGDPKTGLTANLGAIIGLPVITPEKVESLAQAFENQDPAQYLPKDAHPHIVAGYKAQKDAFAKIFRSKNTAWMWLILGGTPSFGPAHQHPMSRGTVYIDPKDPSGEPIVDYRAFSNPIDVATMIEMIRFTRKYMASETFAAYKPKEGQPGASVESDAQLENWIRRQYIPSVYHPVGTAAKMPRELGGVVDEELLVYGVQGLSVVDASIMPIIPGCPTTMTTYAIAEKVSFQTPFNGVKANHQQAAEYIKKRTQG
ncbi:alcohol oxidase [Lindgomyces ingoldianus]|uniref:Alcohol oxidase n=1 Tax=Lindgomyces ingoldianus TaxID=673940 RepID=A0ACB6QGU7_9PLEO|nr:alcohol oxidase [Lindgomyces ingoldianus]KAF2466213.1 alcohol oxidase [Lindgomyces ingoldianus]